MTNAKLSHAILRHSNLTNANLTNTSLVGADICGVNLDRANLKGARLKSVISDRHTQLSINRNRSSMANKEKALAKTETLPAIESPTKIQVNSTGSSNHPKSKSKSNKNLLGILFLGITAVAIAGGYIFLNQNPDFSDQEQFKQWQKKLEQLMPAN